MEREHSLRQCLCCEETRDGRLAEELSRLVRFAAGALKWRQMNLVHSALTPRAVPTRDAEHNTQFRARAEERGCLDCLLTETAPRCSNHASSTS
jgi:hypothetical protein